ncbi:putative dolichyl-P-Man:GDP-Man1GlcNAc2-PP-dolichyl alpha-13-mannosyltransferase [Leptomonas pyrrhocoris]|uniref:Alpha-1,3/1,6-mannosyltransferase ALG2 n=1 Tax=Leptomonas pyrrhocoris TaxID=157538 RepID=A0A0M9G4W2_LEPPY|nr:putative dolichyl-P-Man:GDP-Man1GlcNAc2-PP-dolichyl alpha-13-mannosyltransferase [Leptomonas pyrrhocoris]XP_015660737.1 putative dolichyl-P-Man:GDP-Man1GlcNAc2-PP-dolichyl alpha-13-mannosyltransferase [Leptomonas pyrrhocoris]KPA82297.1 putative dolichyl-P-Man:GDP-Man1GlcNAc2-PP-dolichyl alpha-13-mannosyltransferase [Leptomonas pyrrhocoris]KPA82298.1 putative dolichyl-P-Man:GDP-Man1GlcNAc2-PP-dolichyl alpha-13-mannosyltransferase [Leptomonas pyrrhocoris]|eukprot:XP_015660736.1 putative dolichyl-P-Man:GDP-Man1GlcNAc2-PP-dolichyl alpha-13-mannosyltransferase [Leptomonas pyrrhocoris]
MTSFVLLGMVYAFGAACIVNYFIMFVRMRTTEMYIRRRERLVEAHQTAHRGETQHDEAPATTAADDSVASPDKTAQIVDLLPREPLHIVFLHPDLGIGGAERLVVDAAVGLMKNQSVRPVEVVIVTNHHDPSRAFKETVDGTVRVVVRGSGLPASFFGRGKALCATIRMAFAAFTACWAFPETNCFVVDQVAAAMPVLTFCAGKTPILFYCHFPDQLCDPNRNEDGTLRDSIPGHQAYRGFFDAVEARSLKHATSVVCNSKFSRQTTVRTFPEMADKIDETTDVFYPPVNMDVHHVTTEVLAQSPALQELRDAVNGSITFVSINRYERKKNLTLAVTAFARLLATDEFSPASTGESGTVDTTHPHRRLLLIVAGGYDPRLQENVQYAAELEAHAAELKIPSDQIRFMRNISDDEKAILLSSMRALVYTPSNEHFGIVPVEAMAYGKPVVAIANGGPCESVGDAEREDPSTCGGLLSAPEPAAFADKMAQFAREASYAEKVGTQGRARILQQFSMETFSSKLVRRLQALTAESDSELLKSGLEEEKKKAGKGAVSTPATSPNSPEKMKAD